MSETGGKGGVRPGFPRSGPAPELVESGYGLESSDAPWLHDGLNLADLAHVIDLHERGLIPADARRALLRVLLAAVQTPASEFGYSPADGEPYNSREKRFAEQIGDQAGWLHAGRPRREAVRIAFRLRVRDDVSALIRAGLGLAEALCQTSGRTLTSWLPDQTYLQDAQPSSMAHYLMSFVDPVLREVDRLTAALADVDLSAGGAGGVNGSRLMDDRMRVAQLLGHPGIVENTRDAMWRVDDLIAVVSQATSLVLTQDKLAEDLEIWASPAFGFVALSDGYSRSSVLMAQKRNPYALTMIRGAAGDMIGRTSGLLAISKSASARSDNFIYAHGAVPRAIELAERITRLSAGVVRTLEVDEQRMWQALEAGFSQATDLSEQIMLSAGLDYRSAYRIVGTAVRTAHAAGKRGIDLTSADLAAAARELGHDLHLDAAELAGVLDPRRIVESRVLTGGAAPYVVARMIEDRQARLTQLVDAADRRRETVTRAQADLVARAQTLAEGEV